ncbi:MAG: hypothetical protein JWO37_744 [Acidimicrobiales bacterium]|jgi:hypothetical protein|nr:hypothetical protein [Acidimicrobiales bacterium]
MARATLTSVRAVLLLAKAGPALAAPAIAALSVLAGAAVGGFAAWRVAKTASETAATLERSRQHHEREMAKDARRQTRQEATYIDMLTELQRAIAALEGTLPVMGSDLPVPTPPAEDWYHSINARSAVFASDEVKTSLAAFMAASRAFWVHVDFHRRYAAEEKAMNGHLSPSKVSAKMTSWHEHTAADEARNQARIAMTKVVEHMATDLGMARVDPPPDL